MRQSFVAMAYHVPFVAIVSLILLTPSCKAPPSTIAPVEPIAQTDRLIGTYPELSSGKFAVIADFEDAAHEELIAPECCAVRSGGGIEQTGRFCMQAPARNGQAAIRFTSEAAQRWFLKRDWRPFDTLLLQVFRPIRARTASGTNDPTCEVIVVTGVGDSQRFAPSKFQLREGWNAIRLDLADLREHIAVDDIRELQVRVESLHEGEFIRLDDVLLTYDQDDVFSDAGGGSQTLQVRRIGQRYHISSRRLFEVVFASGQWVGWFDRSPEGDPQRNLLTVVPLSPNHGAALGLQPRFASGSLPSMLATSTQASPMRVIEANAVRVVLQCAHNASMSEEFSTTYTIYPDGAVFLQRRRTNTSASGADCGGGFPFPADWDIDAASKHCWAIAPKHSRSGATIVGNFLAEIPGSSPGSSDANGDAARLRWTDASNCAGFISLGRRSMDDALRMEKAWRTPHRFLFESGSTVVDEELQDGFDPGTGERFVQSEKGVIRFYANAEEFGGLPRVFTIRGSRGKTAWVYIDHALAATPARSAEGELLLSLPEAGGRRLVEVLLDAK